MAIRKIARRIYDDDVVICIVVVEIGIYMRRLVGVFVEWLQSFVSNPPPRARTDFTTPLSFVFALVNEERNAS